MNKEDRRNWSGERGGRERKKGEKKMEKMIQPIKKVGRGCEQ